MPRNNPAAPLATGQIIRLTVGVLVDNQQAEVILDYMQNVSVPVTLGVLQAFLTTWQGLNETKWLATLAADASINLYTVAEVQTGMTPTFVSPQTGKVGTNMTDSYPSYVAAIVSKYTSLKGQHGRGRGMMGPVALNDIAVAIDANKLTAAAIARFTTLWNSLTAPMTVGAVFFQMVVSTRPKPPNTAVTNAVPVSNFVVQPVAGTVRRRRLGRGI